MTEKHSGYTVGNSVLASQIGTGNLFENIRYNPPCFEDGSNKIRPAGSASAEILFDGERISPAEFSVTENIYPLFAAKKELPGGTVLQLEAFAPLTAGKSADMFLPFIMLSLRFSGGGKHTVSLKMSFDSDEEHKFVRVDDAFGTDSAEKTVRLTDGGKITALFGIFDGRNPWRKDFSDEKEISAYGAENYDVLRRGIGEFISAVPVLGDEKVCEYIRWYTQAAVMLTKADDRGNVITMGYNELNQRDSFWTTFMHLMLFPDLERRMIEISASYQSENGKIPTTILPLIERYCDIDINEYFCLRIARYYEYYGDRAFLEKMFPSYKRAVDFILTLDRDGDALPEQDSPENPECFWGDWKDVSYVVGRKLAPHFCLLWLAVLKKGARLSRELHERETAEKYDALFERAYEKINSPWDGTEKGGLMNGDYYCEVWYDKIKRDFVLEDQTAGIFFDTVPEKIIPGIYKSLEKNACLYGIRETYPYREGEEVWNRGGTYHNGGVWPWLNFCDIAGRYKNGREDEALSLIKTLGYYDLELPGDYRPNEYLDGETGQNCGPEVQGWSSAVWAVEYVRRIKEKSPEKKNSLNIH